MHKDHISVLKIFPGGLLRNSIRKRKQFEYNVLLIDNFIKSVSYSIRIELRGKPPGSLEHTTLQTTKKARSTPSNIKHTSIF